METILGTALPFFAVLLCGMLATRLGLLRDAGIVGLNAFVFWFALPALLFQKVATAPFERLTDWTLYAAYTGSTLTLYVLSALLFRLLWRRAWPEAIICAFAAAWGNVGYMGVPLLIAAYGEARALPSVLAVVLDVAILQSLTIFLLESVTAAGKGGLRSVALGVIRNPLILAVILGMAVAAGDFGLPLPLNGFLAMLGAAAAPGALFALGATLRPSALGRDLGLVLAVTAAKLLALPAIAWLVVERLPMAPDLVVPLLLTTALPTAASVFVIAQRYGILERQTAAIVFLSHLLGIASLTGLLVLLGAGGLG